jgi:hypothetical protein
VAFGEAPAVAEIKEGESSPPLLCPAAPQHWPNAKIFAVFVDGQTTPVQIEPVTDQWLEACKPATPRQILRMSATCIKSQCRHWDATRPGAEDDGVCTLAERVIATAPDFAKVVASAGDTVGPDIGFLPLQPCAIRGRGCRWWAQAGATACRPCFNVATDTGSLPQQPEDENAVQFF